VEYRWTRRARRRVYRCDDRGDVLSRRECASSCFCFERAEYSEYHTYGYPGGAPAAHRASCPPCTRRVPVSTLPAAGPTGQAACGRPSQPAARRLTHR
jgi:hypothetical protein